MKKHYSDFTPIIPLIAFYLGVIVLCVIALYRL